MSDNIYDGFDLGKEHVEIDLEDFAMGCYADFQINPPISELSIQNKALRDLGRKLTEGELAAVIGTIYDMVDAVEEVDDSGYPDDNWDPGEI